MALRHTHSVNLVHCGTRMHAWAELASRVCIYAWLCVAAMLCIHHSHACAALQPLDGLLRRLHVYTHLPLLCHLAVTPRVVCVFVPLQMSSHKTCCSSKCGCRCSPCVCLPQVLLLLLRPLVLLGCVECMRVAATVALAQAPVLRRVSAAGAARVNHSRLLLGIASWGCVSAPAGPLALTHVASRPSCQVGTAAVAGHHGRGRNAHKHLCYWQTHASVGKEVQRLQSKTHGCSQRRMPSFTAHVHFGRALSPLCILRLPHADFGYASVMAEKDVTGRACSYAEEVAGTLPYMVGSAWRPSAPAWLPLQAPAVAACGAHASASCSGLIAVAHRHSQWTPAARMGHRGPVRCMHMRGCSL